MSTYTKTYTFTNGTTADGGQVDAEIVALGNSVNNITNAQIDPAANISISKTALGTYTPPTTWVPVWKKNDNTTALSATLSYARYWQIGKQVTCVLRAASIGDPSGINIWATLPVTAAVDGTTQKNVGHGEMVDGSTEWDGYAIIPATGGTQVVFRINRSSAWGTNNAIEITFTYEAA